MGPRLPGVSGKQVVRALTRAGWNTLRVNGGHHNLRDPGRPGSKVIVSVHGSHDLPPGTLRSILRQAGLTAEEFMAFL